MGSGRTFRGLDALRQPSWLTAARVEAVARIAALAFAAVAVLMLVAGGGTAASAALVPRVAFRPDAWAGFLREEPLPWEAAGVQAAPLLGLLLFWLVARRLGAEARRAMPESA
jgi:hypothetical protein